MARLHDHRTRLLLLAPLALLAAVACSEEGGILDEVWLEEVEGTAAESAEQDPQSDQDPQKNQNPAGESLQDRIARLIAEGKLKEARELLEEQEREAVKKRTEWASPTLGVTMQLLHSVFPPQEAEVYVLPFLKDHPEVFKGKTVFEIGTGSGIISIYAAMLGAEKVVATDINPRALESLRINAEIAGVGDKVEGRLVSRDNMGAYAVIGEDERFDVLISNPPYNLDLDALTNSPEIDGGDLCFDLVNHLDEHLTEDGRAVLFMNSLFYHHVIVKLARYRGFTVRTHSAMAVTPWELEALFNGYLERVLEHERLPKDAFRFDHVKDLLPYAMTLELRQYKPEATPLIPGANTGKVYRGFMVVERGD